MSIRSRSLASTPLLLLALGLPTACRSAPRQPPQVSTAGVRIDVDSARQRPRGVVVEIRLWNDYDEEITFEHANVRLVHGGGEVSAKPYRSWRRGVPTVQPKTNLDFRWLFETAEDLPTGQRYVIEIREAMRGGEPLPGTPTFEIVL